MYDNSTVNRISTGGAEGQMCNSMHIMSKRDLSAKPVPLCRWPARRGFAGDRLRGHGPFRDDFGYSSDFAATP